MARVPEIEKILEAWYEEEHCPPSEGAEMAERVRALLDAVAAESQNVYTPDQVRKCLWSRYQDYKKQKRREEKLRIAQSAMRK